MDRRRVELLGRMQAGTATAARANGHAVLLASSSTDTHAITRQILGLAREQSTSETTVGLTATSR